MRTAYCDATMKPSGEAYESLTIPLGCQARDQKNNNIRHFYPPFPAWRSVHSIASREVGVIVSARGLNKFILPGLATWQSHI